MINFIRRNNKTFLLYLHENGNRFVIVRRINFCFPLIDSDCYQILLPIAIIIIYSFIQLNKIRQVGGASDLSDKILFISFIYINNSG